MGKESTNRTMPLPCWCPCWLNATTICRSIAESRSLALGPREGGLGVDVRQDVGVLPALKRRGLPKKKG